MSSAEIHPADSWRQASCLPVQRHLAAAAASARARFVPDVISLGAPPIGNRRHPGTSGAAGATFSGFGSRIVAFSLSAALTLVGVAGHAEVIYDAISAYHHIQVEDTRNLRTLRFDSTTQSQMSLRDPLQGHFEYTEMFHLAWLWYGKITNVLMVGLGGASTQRAFEHDYPGVQMETVEIDPAVLRVAKEYFHFQESPRQRVFLEDGRVFLRRTQKQFDAIFMDAYSQNRYGAFLPQHLVTKEFFTLASSHLTTNGVLAYNVMGTMDGWQSELLGAMYRTMKTVFPEVYLFPCRTSLNVVFIATKSPQRTDLNLLSQRADFLLRERRVTLPTFRTRLQAFHPNPPPSGARALLLTDDFAPVESLLGVGRQN
jgi:spermidine synthase